MKLMNIAAHTSGGYGGVPQKVGADFHAADKAAGKFPKKKATHESLIGGGKKHKRSQADRMYPPKP